MKTTEQKRGELLRKAKGEPPAIIVRVKGKDDNKPTPQDRGGSLFVVAKDERTRENIYRLFKE